MSTKTVPIQDAKNAELIEHALNQGLDAKLGQSNAFLINLIQTAAPGTTEITVQETTPPAGTRAGPPLDPRADPPQVPGDRMVGSSFRDDPRVTVMIPSTDTPGGDRAVQVGVNGVAFLIERNRDVPVPYRVYEALQNSEQINYEQVANPQNPLQPLVVERRVKGYPFSVSERPSEAVVAAWRERVADTFAP